MKKLFAVLLALTLVLSMGTIAFAEGETTSTGSITIENAVKEYNYTIYKMLDFEPTEDKADKGIYTVAEGWSGFFNGAVGKEYFTIDSNGSVTKAKEPDAALARAAVDYAKTATGGFSQSKAAASDEVIFEGLGLGYYAVDTSVGAICSLTNTNSEATAIEKNKLPTLEKKIVENADLVDANNVAIGDTVDYQITVTFGEGLTDYVVKDTMSDGLTFNNDVKVYTVNDEGGLDNVTTGFTVTNVTEHSFNVEFADEYVETAKSETHVIKFSAKLNENAKIGSEGNPNTADFVYKNETVEESTPDDTVITYTTKLTIDKFEVVDGEKKALKGAGFTLYKGSAEEANKVGSEIAGDDITEFVWTGLEAGTYVLVETTVPDGYNKADDITFTIECTAPDKVENGDAKATWSTESTKIIAVNASVFKGEVENKTGLLLPETGGIGTTIFYIVGIVLMLGAGIILVAKKRMASFN